MKVPTEPQEEPGMEQWIVTRPDVLGGKPCIRGTRLSVQHLLELLASGASREEVLSAFPQVTAEGLNAALDYAAHALRNDVIWEVGVPA
jgi:uncharacterized protein (DUF433 family)